MTVAAVVTVVVGYRGWHVAGTAFAEISSDTLPTLPGSDRPAVPSMKPVPLLVQSAGSGPVPTIGGEPAIDACTVLPMSLLTEFGLELDSTQSVRTSRMERPGTGSRAPIDFLGAQGSSCAYPVRDGTQIRWLDVTIAQPPFNDDPSHGRERIMNALARDARRLPDFHGMKVYLARVRNGREATIIADRFTAVVGIGVPLAPRPGLPDPTQIEDAITNRVLENLLRAPTAPMRFSYREPQAATPDPCEVFTPEMFREVYGIEDSGRTVTRHHIGELETYEPTDPVHPRSFWLETSCARGERSEKRHDLDTRGLVVQFDVYRDPAQATTGEYLNCDPSAPIPRPGGQPVPVVQRIGDGLVCVNTILRSPNLVFRVGRTVVLLQEWKPGGQSNPASAITMLTPLAHRIATRLMQ
ncbi:hypothetical protein [Herbihabitans rhizosphaerae]|uniref:hypothetical protein n=1 Tax=Herbihabitans rhizosphaerae TaxID=1872711 RepID=UPI00102BE9D7|nr:hypothetical protein [Herbihabitans rhizosphaerae]